MNFADQTPEKQGRIVARAWQAIGIPREHCTDELMAEWINALQPLSMDAIGVGVTTCQRRKRTAHAVEFAALCLTPFTPSQPSQTVTDRRSAVARNEARRIERIQAGEDVEGREQSMTRLGLHRRWA